MVTNHIVENHLLDEGERGLGKCSLLLLEDGESLDSVIRNDLDTGREMGFAGLRVFKESSEEPPHGQGATGGRRSSCVGSIAVMCVEVGERMEARARAAGGVRPDGERGRGKRRGQ